MQSDGSKPSLHLAYSFTNLRKTKSPILNLFCVIFSNVMLIIFAENFLTTKHLIVGRTQTPLVT